jgi:hypothetical protein
VVTTRMLLGIHAGQCHTQRALSYVKEARNETP